MHNFVIFPARETKKIELNWIEYKEIPTYVKFETSWNSAGYNPYVRRGEGVAVCVMAEVRN